MDRRTPFLAVILTLGLSPWVPADNAPTSRALVDQSYLCGRTLLEMRSIGMALTAYLLDHATLPDDLTSIEQVRPLIEPMYLRKAELDDAWGTPLRLLVGADRTSFRLVSAGSDREFAKGTSGRTGLLDSSAEDAVISSDPAERREWVIQQ